MEECTHGGVYTRRRIQKEENTNGGEYTRRRVHMEKSTHGEEYTRRRVHTEKSTRRRVNTEEWTRGVYTWAIKSMEECTHGGMYTWRKTQTRGKEIHRREVHAEGVYTRSVHKEKSINGREYTEGDYTRRRVCIEESTHHGVYTWGKKSTHHEVYTWRSVHTRGRLNHKEEIPKGSYTRRGDIHRRMLYSMMKLQLSIVSTSRTKRMWEPNRGQESCGAMEDKGIEVPVSSFTKLLILYLRLYLHLHSFYFSRSFSHPPTLLHCCW